MNKYRNTKIEFEGYTFDSKKEMNRFVQLRLLLTAGQISDLLHQPEFMLLDNFEHKTEGKIRGLKYIADFKYEKDGQTVVEDVKGMKTDVYKIKKKFFLAKYPDIIFLET